jgi:hypothetical protein
MRHLRVFTGTFLSLGQSVGILSFFRFGHSVGIGSPLVTGIASFSLLCASRVGVTLGSNTNFLAAHAFESLGRAKLPRGASSKVFGGFGSDQGVFEEASEEAGDWQKVVVAAHIEKAIARNLIENSLPANSQAATEIPEKGRRSGH